MTTQCLSEVVPQIELFQVKNRPVVVSRTATQVSSNGGFLALGKIDRRVELIRAVAACFVDAERNRAVRDPDRVIHGLEDLLRQRVFQMALGYEDGLDADTLRLDPVLQVSVGKDTALGSQPMMSRLENWVSTKDLYRGWHEVVRVYARHFHVAGEPVVLHVDSTEDRCSGQLALFNGYYQDHCFHPLVVTEERTSFPLALIFRNGNVSSAHRVRSVLKRVLRWLREEIPGVQIVVKGDCAFGIADLVNWFEEIQVDYVLGLSGNAVVEKAVAHLAQEVQVEHQETKTPLQRFCSFSYRAQTWKNSHSVIAKVEHTGKGLNQRFVVCSMQAEDPEKLYETYHTRAKGIEAVIEQMKNGLRMDKTACHNKLPNQMRYLESALALILHLKIIDIVEKDLPHRPTVQSVIQKILKIGAIVTRSVRRFLIELSSVDPNTLWLMRILAT